MNYRINWSIILSITAVVFVLLISAGCAALLQKQKNLQIENQSNKVDSVDTSDWKTYRNEEYGFEVKYPAELRTQETGSAQDIAEAKWRVEFRKYLQEGYVTEFQIMFYDKQVPQNLLGGNPINIDGKQAFRRETTFGSLLTSGSSNEPVTLIRIPIESGDLLIVLWHRVKEDRILSTFKFIEPNQALIAPAFYSGLTWSVIPTDNAEHKEIEQNSLYYNSDSIGLTGQMWKAKFENLNDTQMVQKDSIQKGFEDYYNNELKRNGWDWEVNVNGKRLTGASADGPMGSMWGFIKVDGENIRVITLSSFDEYTDFNPEQYSCPCSKAFTVFVSDIVSLNKIFLK